MKTEVMAESIRKGITFLAKRQLPSGEFAIMRWEKPHMHAASYVKSVFITSFVLHSLRHAVDSETVEEISQRAIRFLLDEMEHKGFWRFFGKNSYVHFDVDDTCCILASLKEWEVQMDYHSLASTLLKYRDKQGLFYTWILDVDPPFKKEDNNIDRVVNANALFLYSLLGQSLPEVEEFLIQVVETGAFQERSPYYDSSVAFVYCLTRAYADGRNSRLSAAFAKTKEYLAYLKRRNRTYGDPLENALATVALLSCSNRSREAEQDIEQLISMQQEDGGWPIGIFFTGGPYTEYRIAYGSRELTTAIALEGISKYISPVRATSSQHENLLPTQGCAGPPAAAARRSMGRRTASALEVPTGPGGQSFLEVYATGGDRPIPYWPGYSSIPGFARSCN